MYLFPLRWYFHCNWSLCVRSHLSRHMRRGIQSSLDLPTETKTNLLFFRPPCGKQGDWHQWILDHEQLFRDVALSDWHTAAPGAATYRAHNLAVGETSWNDPWQIITIAIAHGHFFSAQNAMSSGVQGGLVAWTAHHGWPEVHGIFCCRWFLQEWMACSSILALAGVDRNLCWFEAQLLGLSTTNVPAAETSVQYQSHRTVFELCMCEM